MKKLIYLSTLLTVLPFITFPVSANIRTLPVAEDGPAEVLKWEVADIPFKASVKKGQDPFAVDFSASFTGPTGITMEIPGFYNGSNEWVIRFSGSLPGNWEYLTHSSVKKLDNKTGSLSILDKSKEGQHGGIIIPENNPQHCQESSESVGL